MATSRKYSSPSGKTARTAPLKGNKKVSGKFRKAPAKKSGSGYMRFSAGEPAGFGGIGWVTQYFDPKGFISVDRVARNFGMSKGQIAETMGLKPETLYRGARLTATKTQARATEMLEIIGRIVHLAGGEKQAMAWYRAEPIPAFGGRTAESLVKEGKAGAVRDYLDHIATGGFA